MFSAAHKQAWPVRHIAQPELPRVAGNTGRVKTFDVLEWNHGAGGIGFADAKKPASENNSRCDVIENRWISLLRICRCQVASAQIWG